MIQPTTDPDLSKDVETLAGELFADPQVWLDTPHDLLGGDTPRELIRNQPQAEQVVRDLLRGLKHGISP